MIFDLPGGIKGYGHLGDTLAFHSNMTIAPALGLGVFVTTNGEGGGSLAQALPSAVLQHFHGAPRIFPRPGTTDLVGASDVFSGHYLTTRRAFSGLEGFVTRLGGGADVEVTPGGRLLLKRLGGVEAFVLDGPAEAGRFISVNGDERLVFRIRDGRATGIQTAFNTETLQRSAFFDRPLLLIVMATLTALAAVATFAGLALRNSRDLRQNQVQARASMVQAMQAGLWISALLLFGLWAAGASDQQDLVYNWPGLLVVTASACALVAAVLTFITLAALPAIWQGGRRVESWTGLRKTFFTVTVLVYAGFSVLLAMGGALEPWSR